tara:strand:- start:31450 stop:31686 length:237 start_codon:yes stop_codon:yes gene_type:complete
MKLLEEASENAIKVVAYNKAYYAQLMTIDVKTRRICSRFMSCRDMEPEERELLAEELLTLQKARSKVVKDIFKLNLIE